MDNEKRVVQISLDIVVGCECDGMELADDVADELERRGFRVVGAGFQEDMTDLYKRNYPKLICEEEQTNTNNDYFYFEAVEVCPHCMSENVYPMWDTEVSGCVAVCKYCGKEIMLCDECQHTILQDGEVHNCDWCKTETGGKCHRGTTKD